MAYNKNTLMGKMPDGTYRRFNSEKEYEDEYYDALFELQNCFSLDLPEDWQV